MLNEKQKLFYKALKQIKDENVDIFTSYLDPRSKLNSTEYEKEYKHLQNKLDTEEDYLAFKKIQNEIIETVITEIMVMIDGYGGLEFELDIIDRKTKESLRKNIQLHDCWEEYLK